ncbi:PDZ domain-containing protein [Strongyloides ratti]|uniref:PDZ domain-containing protein n=1 Tax=Strongyloides ratti TaxID=34506 RepID=A0A090L8L5_STRRB|nr:PDZ domain-containing protein [Strongyloides ratti]CEF66116.1 PDZ domain-containing protein [Strongyloides ratti]
MTNNHDVVRLGFKKIDINFEKTKNNETLGVIIRQKNDYCMITKCESGSWGAKFLKMQDTIIKIDGITITNKDECVKQLTECMKNKSNGIIVVERPESIDAKVWAASVVNEESALSATAKMALMYSKNTNPPPPTSSTTQTPPISPTPKKNSVPNSTYGCKNFSFGQDVKDIVIAELERIKNGGLSTPTFSIMKQDTFEKGQRKTFVNDIVGEIPIVPDLSKPTMRSVGKIYMGK